MSVVVENIQPNEKGREVCVAPLSSGRLNSSQLERVVHYSQNFTRLS